MHFTNLRMARWIFGIIAVVTFSCSDKHDASINKFADPIILQIADAQDRRHSDSLLQFIQSPNAVYRREAVMAFASIQDSSVVEAIGKLLLEDEDNSVRKAAAFALGQTASLRSESILVQAIKTEKELPVLNEIIEAYGMVASKWNPETLPDDFILLDKISWYAYRAGLRGLNNDVLNHVASNLLHSNNNDTRLGAAHYFGRSATGFESFQHALIASAENDKVPEVRMASTYALRKINTDSSRAAAGKILRNDSDYRVRVSAVRALQTFSFSQTKDDLLTALSDKNVNVGIIASEVILATIEPTFWKELLPFCRKETNGRIQANLYEAALAGSDHKELAEEIISIYQKTQDVYHQAALLGALSRSVMSFGFVQDQLFASTSPVIRSAAANTLVLMNRGKNFDPSLKNRFASIYQEAFERGDPAVIAIVSNALADSTLGYKNLLKDFSFLHKTREKLNPPKDIETIQHLNAAIAYFEGKISVPIENSFNHPIDWALVKTLSREQTATISTTKGDISVRLFVEEAPGSVANFVALARNHYYEGKTFHRVVPNFVAQGGCNRGDGFGSEDYSIRSEFSGRKYTTGSLGMASAGKDSEGTQWFFTHSPTPHLDGRYTIFGEVLQGMEIVHTLEVGDKILKINLNE